MPVIPVLGRLRQEDFKALKANVGYTEFQASQSGTVRFCPKTKQILSVNFVLKYTFECLEYILKQLL